MIAIDIKSMMSNGTKRASSTISQQTKHRARKGDIKKRVRAVCCGSQKQRFGS
jgi:hypothetical protein